MYWPQVVGTLLFAIVVWRYVALGRWEAFMQPFAWAGFGYLSVIASDEVANWTGRYGWTYDSFWTYPPTYVRCFGFILLIGVLLFGF